MPTVAHRLLLDDEGLARLLVPRDDLVAEQPAVDDDGGRITFALRDGPCRHYQREVEVGPTGPDGQREVHERFDYELAITYFAVVFAWPFRRVLRRRPTGPRPPWWAPPERLDRRAAEALDVLAAASLIVGFIGTLVTQTITFASDEFGTSESAQGVGLSVVRAGIVLSLGLVALADRRGRRRVILATMIAGPILAAAGSIAPSFGWLIASQAVGRPLSLCLGIVIGIVAAEEVPAGCRAYATSLMAMAGAFGAGLCVMVLPLADLGLRGWRLVYVLPLAGLVLVPGVARRLPESRRFLAPHAPATWRGHRRRLGLLCASGFLVNLFIAPASSFQNRYLREERGYSASRISLFTVCTSTPGGIGIVVGGRLADLRGRKLVGAIALGIGPACSAIGFLVAGWGMWAVSVMGSVIAAAAVPSLGVYGPELFPTALRARAGGVVTSATLLGSITGLLLVGWVTDSNDAVGPVLAACALGPVVVAAMVLLLYPETARRELEELNPEDALGDGPGATARPPS